MSTNRSPLKDTNQAARGVALVIHRIARRVGSVVAECNHAQRRLTQLRLSPDSYIPDHDCAPSTYSEFLFRTSGPLQREPSARARAASQSGRR
jgi:hypothetical protein